MSAADPAIIIGIPGKWKDRSEIVTSIASRSGGYIFAGMVLMHAETGKTFRLEIDGHNPALAGSMRTEGMGHIPEEDLLLLEEHTFTLYLLSDETGREVVEEMRRATLALLESGGIAVKIDTAGLSLSAARWRELCEMETAWPLYRAMVAFVGEETNYFTCGMRAFSLPDCHVTGSEPDTAFELVTEFCCYLLNESPALADGHTFGIAEGSTSYRMSLESYFYPPDEYRHNPHGMWMLKPLE